MLVDFSVCYMLWQDYMIEGSCPFTGSKLIWVSHHPTKFRVLRHCGIGDNGLSMSGDLGRPLSYRFPRLYGYEALIISHHSAKFGGHIKCSGGDIAFLMTEEQDYKCSLKSVITA